MSVRAAAVQFAVGSDVEENLATCLRMLGAAAEAGPDLIVLPEFCNHLSWYDDRAHAYRAALDLEGPFLRAIGAAVAEIGAYVQINCTIRRDGDRVTGTNLLYDPRGALVASSDKKVLMGAEGDFLTPGDRAPGPIVETPLGRIGLYACMEGVIFELPRCLAVAGAQILLNSLNSFALDEAALHIPVRAAENRVFVVAANKVGPLLPPDQIERISAGINVPVGALHGAGESQIVAPDGTVLAKAPRTGEAVVVADLDVARADDKTRADGTDIMAARRPAAYGPIAQRSEPPATSGADRIEVAACAPASTGTAAIDEAAGEVAALARDGVALIVLPELFFADGVTDVVTASARAVDAVTRALDGTNARAVLTVAEPDAHVGVVVSAAGVEARQAMMHARAGLPWATALADRIAVVEVPWGRLAVVLGSDAVFPEVVRLAALAGAEVVAVPAAVGETWESALGLPERAAENRVNLVAARRRADAVGSLIAALPADLSLWAPERSRPFDGRINTPDVVHAEADGVLRGVVFPARARHRQISKNTDVVDGRPWHLVEALVR